MQQAHCPVLLCKGMPDDWDDDEEDDLTGWEIIYTQE